MAVAKKNRKGVELFKAGLKKKRSRDLLTLPRQRLT